MKQNTFSVYKEQNWQFNYASAPIEELANFLETGGSGLIEAEAAKRLNLYGLNQVRTGQDKLLILDFLSRFTSPLIILLLVIAAFSFFFGDKLSTIVVSAMILMSVGLSFFQERRAQSAALKLEAMVQTMCKAVRGGETKEIPLKNIVPGDIVSLSAGDIIPGDIRISESKDLFINQSSLTGESFPVEKFAEISSGDESISPQLKNMAFMGSSVVSGIGAGIVIHTGQNTAFGELSRKLLESKSQTLFDKQTKDFTWLMIRIITLVVFAVLGVYIMRHHNILESFMFALAVAVQITPETLPMIVTINLAKGALAMSRKKTIVKRLNSVQNLGAMDVLCSDKTGTLTLNEVTLQKHVNVEGGDDEEVFKYGYINSYYLTGLKNLLNLAVLKHQREDLHGYAKLDEIPFDFERKINTVIIKNENRIMISVGAPEEIIKRCSGYEIHGIGKALDKNQHKQVLGPFYDLSSEGYRVLAVAYKNCDSRDSYTTADENNLRLRGYMAFFDPAKPTAKIAINTLRDAGVAFKIVTGDNELVTKKICSDLGLAVHRVVLGSRLEPISDIELSELAEVTTVFARVTPEQKERIIRCLRHKGHTVGYLGDGINDALSLRAADVGISVNNAVDVAKESAAVILLEKDLLTLAAGVLEGRKVFGNFMKYIRMTGMINVGYMISTICASLVFPFLPMAPVQMLLNNYLYEVGQTGIPSDNVDQEYFKRPRKWNIRLLVKFMLILGPIASVFDFLTFGILWWVFSASANENIFQTGWFLETMLAQVMLIFFIRTRRLPFLKSRPSLFLAAISAAVLGAVFVLPFTPLAGALHLVKMPLMFYPVVVMVVLAYLLTVWLIKNWFIDVVEND